MTAATTRTTGPRVRFAYGADDWKLYAVEGRDDVAAAINAGLADIIAASPTYDDVDWSAVITLLARHKRHGAGREDAYRMAGRLIAAVFGN